MRGAAACRACLKGTPKRGRPRCPECVHIFRGTGWDGIVAHWKAKHSDVMPYAEFWASLCPAHRAAGPLGCPSCLKGIPAGLRQCPECAQVFRGKSWGGVDAHWKARHLDITSYEDFWASLCPAHRGDPATGYLPLEPPPPARRKRRGSA